MSSADVRLAVVVVNHLHRFNAATPEEAAAKGRAALKAATAIASNSLIPEQARVLRQHSPRAGPSCILCNVVAAPKPQVVRTRSRRGYAGADRRRDSCARLTADVPRLYSAKLWLAQRAIASSCSSAPACAAGSRRCSVRSWAPHWGSARFSSAAFSAVLPAPRSARRWRGAGTGFIGKPHAPRRWGQRQGFWRQPLWRRRRSEVRSAPF